MPNVDRCPRCGEEFNENDIEEARLYRDFKKLCNQEALKKDRRIKRFLGSPLPVMFLFFLAYWADRYPWVIIWALAITIVMFWVPRAMDKKEKALFEQYKKDFYFPPKDLP